MSDVMLGNEVSQVKVGDRLLFPRETGRLRWTVKARSERFIVLTQQVPFRPKIVLRYTVVDVDSGHRGPCDLIGQGYGDGSYSTAECAAMLAAFESGDLEISHRNNVPVIAETSDG